MKYWFGVIGLFFGIFLGMLFFSFLYLFSLINIFANFNLITDVLGAKIAIYASLFFSIGVLIYEIVQFNSDKKTKFSNWIAMSYPKLILYYVISLICFVSIKSEIIFTIGELRDLISLEWTIFGIIITIFLVWNVIIVDYLKRKKPTNEINASPIQRMKYLKNKGEFFTNASISFNSITLITINILMLILSTGSAYISANKINLFNQNFAIVAFYFTTNTLLEFFLDILQPLKESKKELLDGTKVSQEEVVELNLIEEKTNRLLATLQQIENSTAFTNEQRQEIKRKLILGYLGAGETLQKIEEKHEQTKKEEIA